MNGSDCGMFTCKYAEYITKDKAITFTQVGWLSLASEASHVRQTRSDTFSFLAETHAVFQEADGVGDLKPETSVIRSFRGLAWESNDMRRCLRVFFLFKELSFIPQIGHLSKKETQK